MKRCNALLVVIGPHWPGASPGGSGLVDDRTDFLGLQVAQAFTRNVPVIPLLIDRTEMPSWSSLPSGFESLALRMALRVNSGADFDRQIDRLGRSLEPTFRTSAVEELQEATRPATSASPP